MPVAHGSLPRTQGVGPNGGGTSHQWKGLAQFVGTRFPGAAGAQVRTSPAADAGRPRTAKATSVASVVGASGFGGGILCSGAQRPDHAAGLRHEGRFGTATLRGRWQPPSFAGFDAIHLATQMCGTSPSTGAGGINHAHASWFLGSRGRSFCNATGDAVCGGAEHASFGAAGAAPCGLTEGYSGG